MSIIEESKTERSGQNPESFQHLEMRREELESSEGGSERKSVPRGVVFQKRRSSTQQNAAKKPSKGRTERKMNVGLDSMASL